MRILIDIGHPAHVHLFKNFAWEMQKKGHQIFFTCREKEYEIQLLTYYDFDYKSFGKKYTSTFGKLFGLIEFDIKEFIQSLKFEPNILFSHGSMYAAHVAWLLGIPHVSMEDTGNHEQIKFYLPYTDVVLTPDVLQSELGHKQIKYSGYHELAYLHPNRYSNNNRNGGNKPVFKEDYAIIRFVSWNATHDRWQTGFTDSQKAEMIDYLLSKMKVIISSEGSLPGNYEMYKYKLSPESMHDILAGAKLFVGEGATMASEAGILGIPAIYVNSQISLYNQDQEKYGLVYNFRNGKNVLNKIEEIVKMHNAKKDWQERRNKMLEDKIDVTAFMVWFIENFPESLKIIKNDPKYQYNFK
jgi:uncharacterized protein